MVQNKLLMYYKATEEEKLNCVNISDKVRFVYSRHQDAVDSDEFLLMWYEHHFGTVSKKEDVIKRAGRHLRNKLKLFTRSIMAEIYARKQEANSQYWGSE